MDPTGGGQDGPRPETRGGVRGDGVGKEKIATKVLLWNERRERRANSFEETVTIQLKYTTNQN